MPSFDVIVIGGGTNGLAAAHRLAASGRKVLLLESGPVAGGAAVAQEFAPGFRTPGLAHLANMIDPRVPSGMELGRHGLGCVTTAWWAEYEQPRYAAPVVGALLVAPPDVERPGRDPRLARFGACPRKPLPFPSFLVASGNDPPCPFDTAVSLARDWGSRFAFAGDVGHLDASSNLGEWPLGERLLNRLIAEMTECPDAKGTLPACASAS